MKKLNISLILLIFPYFVFATGVYSVRTLNNSEINQSLQNKIHQKSMGIIENVRNADVSSLKRNFSPGLLNKSENGLESFLKQIQALFKASQFETTDVYYSKLAKLGSANKVSIIPFVNGERSLNVHGVEIPEKEAYFHLLKSTHPTSKALGVLVYMQYVKLSNVWKLHSFHVGNYTIEGKIAPDFMQMCGKSDKSIIGASLINCIAASKVMKPATFLQYPKEKQYNDTIQEKIKNFNRQFKFPIQLKAVKSSSIYGINIHITQQGILPLINYITPTEFNNQKAFKEEAKKVMEEINQHFPSLKTSFEYILLQAFNAVPSDPKKQYPTFKTVYQRGKQL